MVDSVIGMLVNFFSLFVGMIGAVLSYIAYRKSRSLKTVSWNDLQIATKYIWKELKKIQFTPDIILSPDPKGGIVGHMISKFYDNDIFTNIGHAMRKGRARSVSFSDTSYFVLGTNKWEVALSKQIIEMDGKSDLKVLIVDDFVLSGDFNEELVDLLLGAGYQRENIIVCCVAVTTVAIQSEKAPKFYWKVVDNEDFYFPWGKAE